MGRRFSAKLFLALSILLSFGCNSLESINSDVADSSSGGGTPTVSVVLTYDIVDDSEGSDLLLYGDVPVFSAVATNFDLTLVDGVTYIATWEFLLNSSVSYVRLAGATGAIVDPLAVPSAYNDTSHAVGVSMLHSSLARDEQVRLVIRDASNNLIVKSNYVSYNKLPPCTNPIWNGGSGTTIAAADPFEFAFEDDPADTNPYYDFVDVNKLTLGKKAGVATTFTYTAEGTRVLNGNFAEWTSLDMSDIPAGAATIRVILRDSSDDAICSIEKAYTFN